MFTSMERDGHENIKMRSFSRAATRHHHFAEYGSGRSRVFSPRRAGFTLIEVMVALAIFMLLMTIIFVPLNQAVNILHVGRSRAEVQQAAQQTINQIERELRAAITIYPNDIVPGVTDKAPYNGKAPYFAPNCDRISSTSRIDMLLPQTDDNGIVTNPVRPADYIVSYYTRRLELKDDAKSFDIIDNPVVLYRAQMPYRKSDGTDMANMDVKSTRYDDDACPSGSSLSGSSWLKQTTAGEFNLVPFSNDAGTATDTVGSHTLASPRGMGLTAPNAASTIIDYTPDTSFICEDTNDDGKIDRVTINFSLSQYDASGAGTRNGKAVGQTVRLSQIVDLPNIGK
jgi:prepilin-type N-terminal cleavage/methylation domain-containing protein